MSKIRKLTSQEFDYLTKLEPYKPNNDQNDYKRLKYTLIDSIEGAIGEKWFNLHDSTKQAIDYICFLSIQCGFMWASVDHIATKHGISASTLYVHLKTLQDSGVLYKANRSSKKQNGLEDGVYFFTMHPYFEHVCSFLNLDWKPQQKAEWKAESVIIPCPTREVSVNLASTYSLPSHDIKDIDTQSTVLPNGQAKFSKTIIKYVPKEINTLYANIFDFRLRFIWQKITQAYKTIKQVILNREDLIIIGKSIIKRIYQKWKEHSHSNRDMSVDDMCAYAYTSARESFYNALAEVYMEKFEEVHEDYLCCKEEQLEMAKEEISHMEDVYLRSKPYAALGMVKSAVMKDMPLVFPLLGRDDLAYLDHNYTMYSSQDRLVVEFYRTIGEFKEAAYTSG
jgi:DNA-binding transcriptional ArsR family regulator